MTARVRKLVGGVGLVAFVIAYAVVAVMIAVHLPSQPMVQLVYFLVVGIAWGVPVIPLIAWMNRGR